MSFGELLDIHAWRRAVQSSNEDALGHMSYSLLQAILRGDLSPDFVTHLLESDVAELRDHGAWIASELGVSALPILAECISLLSDRSPRVRYYGMTAIQAVGEPGLDAAFAQIVGALSDEDPRIRAVAADVLVASGEDVFHKHVAAVLAGDSATAARPVVECLRLGVACDTDDVQQLQRYLHSTQVGIRVASIVAAVRRGARYAPVAEGGLRHFDPGTREAAARFSYRFQDALVPAVLELLRPDECDSVLDAALTALAKTSYTYSTDDRAAVRRLLEHATPLVRMSALHVMARWAPLTADELREAVTRLKDSNESARFAATETVKVHVSRKGVVPDWLPGELMEVSLDQSVEETQRAEIVRLMAELPARAITEAVLARNRDVHQLLVGEYRWLVTNALHLFLKCSSRPSSVIDAAKRLCAESEPSDVQRLAAQLVRDS